MADPTRHNPMQKQTKQQEEVFEKQAGVEFEEETRAKTGEDEGGTR